MKRLPESSRESDLEIVLISVAEIGSGALDAHLGELARRLSRHALVHWAALASPRIIAGSGRGVLASFRERVTPVLSGRLFLLPHGPRFALMGVAGRLLGWQLRRSGIGLGAILHARGYLATLAALQARDALPGSAIVHDVRGDRPAEVRAHPEEGEASPERVAEREAMACQGADAHLAVSEPLASLLRARHGVDASVFACAVDCERFRPDPAGRARVRSELGLGERFVLGFVGSCAGWQQPGALAGLFEKLRTFRPDARLLVISPDHEAWTRELARHGLEADSPGRARPDARVIVRSAQRDAVPAWFSACDATALLRAADDVNRVASPIKFGESLACGVPVLVTSRLGDVSKLVASHALGACFDDLHLEGREDMARLRAVVARIEQEPRPLAEACRAAAVAEWSWDSQLPRRLEFYRRLAAGLPVPRPGDMTVSARVPARTEFP